MYYFLGIAVPYSVFRQLCNSVFYLILFLVENWRYIYVLYSTIHTPYSHAQHLCTVDVPRICILAFNFARLMVERTWALHRTSPRPPQQVIIV